MRGILDKLQEGRPVTSNGYAYLRQLGLTELAKLARGEISYETFRESAAVEKAKREHLAEAEKQAIEASMLARAAEQVARDAAYWAQQEAARLARESDPKYIA